MTSMAARESTYTPERLCDEIDAAMDKLQARGKALDPMLVAVEVCGRHNDVLTDTFMGEDEIDLEDITSCAFWRFVGWSLVQEAAAHAIAERARAAEHTKEGADGEHGDTRER